MDSYATYLPILLECLKHIPKNPIEIGVGWYSTPIIQAFNGTSVELESPEDWQGLVSKVYPVIDYLPSGEFGVCLIDSWPENSRVPIALQMVKNSQLLILHDSDPEWASEYQYDKLFDSFKYLYPFESFKPNTLVLTNNEFSWLSNFADRIKIT